MQTTTIVAPKVSRAIGTAATSVGAYSPAGAIGAIISGLVVANTSAGQILVTVTVFDGTNSTNLCFQTPVAIGDSLPLGGSEFKMNLVNGWFIQVKSSVAASCDATMFVTEFQ